MLYAMFVMVQKKLNVQSATQISIKWIQNAHSNAVKIIR
jgi:hypothetical protein